MRGTQVRPRSGTVLVAVALALGISVFAACGTSDAGAPETTEPTTAPGPAKGILDAATVARVTAVDGKAVFESDEAACIARNLDGGVDDAELGWIKAGNLSPESDFPPHQDLVEQVSRLGRGCLTEERLHDATVAALVKGMHGSPEYAACLVDSGFFSPAVGYVFKWTMNGLSPAETKSADVDSDCGS